MSAPTLGSPPRNLRFVPSLGDVEGVALLAVALWVAADAALPAYQVRGAPGVLAGTAAGGVLISFVAARIVGVPAVVAYVASLAGLALLFVAVVGPEPGAIASAMAHGPNQLLSETLPLAGGPVALAPLIVVGWLCSVAATEIFLRAGGPRRLAALMVPALLYVLCFAAASPAPNHYWITAPALLVLLATLAAVTALEERPAAATEGSGPPAPTRPELRTLLAGPVVAVAVAAVVAAVAPSVPGLSGPPASLRRHPPLVAPAIVDPVDVMAQSRDADPGAPPTRLLTVRTDESSDGYLALAELDAYDGAEWDFTATFQPTGGRVPPAPSGSQVVGTKAVQQSVSVDHPLPVPLLPALDRPRSVAGTAVAADPATGMLLPQAGYPSRRYSVSSLSPDSALSGIPAADGIDLALGPPESLALPPDTSTELASTLRFLSSLTGERPTPNVAYLQRVLEVLHGAERRVAPAPTTNPGTTSLHPGLQPSGSEVAGTSLSQVVQAVVVDRAATPEQLATFYAMVARYLGVPARIVTGFRVVSSSRGSLLPPGTYDVTNRQAWAWVEIPISGVGWVVADPTPDATTSAASPPPEAVRTPVTTLPPRPANAVPRNQITGGHALAPPSHLRTASPASTPAWVLPSVLALVALLIAGLAGPGQAAARRYWRRRRRKSPDPAELAVGAWLELIDGLSRAGMPVPAGATNGEVAADVANHFDIDLVESVATVAATAERAVCSMAEPVDDESAIRCWELQRAVSRRLRTTLDRRARLQHLVTVGTAPSRPVPSPSAPSRVRPRRPLGSRFGSRSPGEH